MRIRRATAALIATITAAIALAGTAGAVPAIGTPEFDIYMQALQRNGFNVTPDTALHAAQIACEGAWYSGLPYELLPQGVVGKVNIQRLLSVATQNLCPIQ